MSGFASNVILRPIAALTIMIACSDSPTVPPGPPKLVFTTQPANVFAGQKIPQVVVALQNDNGSILKGDNRTVTISTVSTGPLTGTLAVAAVNGVATFSDLRIDVAADGYQLYASAGGAVSSYSTRFDVKAGQAARLAFTTQPIDGTAVISLSPVRVRVTDALGNLVNNAPSEVTISLGNNPAGATLTGTLTSNTTNGTAEFNELKIDMPGTGYTLVAQGAGLTPVTSVAFNIKGSLMFTAISSGYFHSCGLTVAGKAYCWGSNSASQLGTGSSSSAVSRPVEVAGARSFTSISSGRDHTCAIEAQAAYCWGTSLPGALGNGVTPVIGAPTAVSGNVSFAMIFAGYEHSCGVTVQATAYCWGDNSLGAIGDNTLASTHVPTAVAGGLSFASVSAGRYFSCGLTTGGDAYCWGSNVIGELGDATQITRNTPAPVFTTEKFTTIGAGGSHACALREGDAVVFCWGSNVFGQLGQEAIDFTRIPLLVVANVRFAQLSVGNRHTCALSTTGDAYCWGDNSTRALGDGTSTSRTAPTLVAGGIKFKSISAGRFHTCGVSVSGVGYCWGENGSGALGDGTFVNRSVPTPIR